MPYDTEACGGSGALVGCAVPYRLETPRGTQRRQTQAVNSVDGQTRVNRAVWQLAEEMRRIKG